MNTIPLFDESPIYDYKNGTCIGSSQCSVLFTENINSKEDVLIHQGGTDSGKTIQNLKSLFFWAISEKKEVIESDPEGFIITVVAESVPNLKKGAYRLAKNIANMKGVKPYILSNNKTDRDIVFKNGAVMEFTSYEDEEQAKQGKRKYLFINECQKTHWKIAWQLMKKTRFKVLLDYNPTAKFWAHSELIDKPDSTGENRNDLSKSVKLIISDHRHNPFLPLSEHEKTENIKDKELWRVYARGMTGKLSGSVYHWNSVDAFPTNCKRIVWGLDIGWTNDPTVLTKIAIAPVGLDYDYVFQELSYAPGISAGYINQLLIENGYKFGQPVYMDHSNPLKKQLRSLRIVAVNAEKGKGSVEARVLHLRSNRCAYTKDSENISMELSKYVFLEVNGELRNQPIGTNNHAMNSCEYGAYTDYVHNRNKI